MELFIHKLETQTVNTRFALSEKPEFANKIELVKSNSVYIAQFEALVTKQTSTRTKGEENKLRNWKLRDHSPSMALNKHTLTENAVHECSDYVSLHKTIFGYFPLI